MYALVNRTPVRSMVDGLVAEVKVKSGQKVKKGDLLVRLDDSEIKLEYEAASIKYESAERKYEIIKKIASEKNTVSLYERGEIETPYRLAKIELERCALKLDRTKIVSPIDGVVEGIAVGMSRGKKVNAGDELLWIESQEKISSSQPTRLRSGL